MRGINCFLRCTRDVLHA